MTPTPELRPRSVSVSKRVYWTLSVISKGLIGDGERRPELTIDGIVDTLLTQAIEAKWPHLMDGFSKKEKVDAEYIAMVALGAKDGAADAAILKAKAQ